MTNNPFRRFGLWFVAALLAAQPGGVLVAAVALPEPFPQSSLQSTMDIDSPGHLVLFSPVREVNSEIRSETMARLPVSGQGQLYEISKDSNRQEARDHYVKLLQAEGASILFECAGIRCGRSNVWANQVFGQMELYGRDGTQDYLVAGARAPDGGIILTSVYTVTRGNLREYVWVERLQVATGASVPGMDNGQDRILGPVIVHWQGGVTYRFDWTATDRRRIREWAGEGANTVVLTAFAGLEAGQTFEESMANADRAARSLLEVLEKSGVRVDQQKMIVIGPVVSFSDPERQGNRVEVTVIRQP